MLGIMSAMSGGPLITKEKPPISFNIDYSTALGKTLGIFGLFGEMNKNLPLIPAPGVDRGGPVIYLPSGESKQDKKEDAKPEGTSKLVYNRFKPVTYNSDVNIFDSEKLRGAYTRLLEENGVASVEYKSGSFRARDGDLVDGVRYHDKEHVIASTRGKPAEARYNLAHEACHYKPGMRESDVDSLVAMFARAEDPEIMPYIRHFNN